MLVKLLGGIDLIAGFTFLMLIFGIQPFTSLLLFCAGLLLIKGMFVITGDVLSIIDLGASILLFISLFITPWTSVLWVPTFLLIAKGLVSFL